MNITGKTAERYVTAVEIEAERTRLYDALAKAQHDHELAKRKMKEAEYAVSVSVGNLDDFEGEIGAAS